MMIDQIAFYPWSDPNYIDAIYYGHSTSTGGDCGIRLSLLAYKLKAFLKVGDQIQMNKRLVRGSNDNDGTDTVSIYSSDGALLLARVTAGRPGRIEADILKGLTMAVQNNLCSDGKKTMLRVLFTDGASGQCALDAMTQRCCAMWNATYAVRLQDAFTSPPGTMGPPSPFISFEVARTDFWQAVQ